METGPRNSTCMDKANTVSKIADLMVIQKNCKFYEISKHKNYPEWILKNDENVFC